MAHAHRTQADLAQFAGATDPLEGVTLPDREYEWRDEPTEVVDGLTIVQPDVVSRGSPGVVDVGGDCLIRANEFGYVVDGLDEFLAANRDREIDIPAYYTRFDEEFDTYVGAVTAANDSFGAGIPPRRLEAGVRAATGGGAFSSKETEVIACGDRPMIVRNEQGAFAVITVDVARPDGYDEPLPERDVAGLSVPETDPRVLRGIDVVDDALGECFDMGLASHDSLANGTHTFVTTDGRPLSIKGRHLRRFGCIRTDPADVLGEMEYESPWAETFTTEVEALDYARGDSTKYRSNPPEQRPTNHVVIGFSRYWSDPRRSSRVSLSGRVKAGIRYVSMHLSVSPDGELTVDYDTTKERTYQERPPEREYDPLNDF